MFPFSDRARAKIDGYRIALGNPGSDAVTEKAKSKKSAVSTVSEYVSAVPQEHRREFQRILDLIWKTVPGSKQVISYRIPAFRREQVFMYCAAFKGHVGIYPPVRDPRLRPLLKPYANAKGNLRFPWDEPIPYSIIARVARTLARQIAAPVGRPKKGE